MPIATRLDAIQALGKFFGMSAAASKPVSRLLPASTQASDDGVAP